jgi:hypothetical protein
MTPSKTSGGKKGTPTRSSGGKKTAAQKNSSTSNKLVVLMILLH